MGSITHGVYVTGQDGKQQYHSNQHIDLQQQVKDFMSGTGFFEQPDIGRLAMELF